MIITINIKTDTAGFEKIIVNCDSKTPEIVRAFGFAIEGMAKTFAPVDTGWLRDSIQTTMIEPTLARVQSDANYDIYQELGTYKMAAHPFLAPAAESIAGQFLSPETWRPLIE